MVGTAVPFRDGLLCLMPPTARLQAVLADAGGCAVSTVSIAAEGSLQPGDQRGYQFWYRRPGRALRRGQQPVERLVGRLAVGGSRYGSRKSAHLGAHLGLH